MNTLFSECRILYIDHLAVTTPVFDQTLQNYLSLPGSRLIRGPAINGRQRVHYAFVALQDGLTIEILGAEADSPISGHLRQGGGAYHFCFAVADLQSALAAAERAGARVIVPPTADPAFDGRRITFLFHESQGIFEFVEAYPIPKAMSIQVDTSEKCQLPVKRSPGEKTDEVELRLGEAFRKAFPGMAVERIREARMEDGEWDSLAHIQLIMEIEGAFTVTIPPEAIEKLTSFSALLTYLRKELA